MDIECAGTVDIKEADSKYRLLFECALDMVFLIDFNGKIMDVNYAVVTEYGYTREQLLSMNIKDLRAPGERGSAVRQLREAFAKGTIYETIHIRKDGSVFPVEVSSRGLVIEDKKMLLAIVRDVSKRKGEERALSRLAAIVESSVDAIIGMTPDGIITEWNDGATRMYGYTAKEMIGRPVEILIPRENREELAHIIGIIKHGGQIEHYDTVRVRKDGKHIFVSFAASPIKGHGGELLGISWTARDITERKMAEEELKESRANAELYLDLMSHDINNMNHAAMGFLELGLESKTLDDAKALMAKPLEIMKNSSRLIDNVRKIQISREKAPKLHTVDFCGILQNLKEQYSHVPGRNVEINFMSLAGCFVKADDLIRDVFSNLLDNAVKHSEGVNPLIINLSVDAVKDGGKKYYRAVVEDNGPGIPDGLKARLFTRLQSGKTKATGRGLGLYLVKTLVQKYRGKIWVEDRVPGDHTKGAKFVVMLPAIE